MEKKHLEIDLNKTIKSLRSRLSKEKFSPKESEKKNTNKFYAVTNKFLYISIFLAFFSLTLTIQPLFELLSFSENEINNPKIQNFENKIIELKKSNYKLASQIAQFDKNKNLPNNQSKLFIEKDSFINSLQSEIKLKDNQITTLKENLAGLNSKTFIQEKKITSALKVIDDLENERKNLISIIENYKLNKIELSKINL